MKDTSQLIKKIFIKGELQVLTGLMIGSSSAAMGIGGVDKMVIRHPITRLPYIPGSSIKGKLRSLLELNLGQVSKDERGNTGPTHDPKHLPAQLFGYIKHRQNDKKSQQPSKLIIRDGELLNGDWLQGTELAYTEVKAENSIDRITAAANPRFFERVPKGAIFQLEIILNIFDSDEDKEIELLNGVFHAMRLLNDDYLGGGGSRGNGQVNVRLKGMEERTLSYYKNESESEIRNEKIPNDLKTDKLSYAE